MTYNELVNEAAKIGDWFINGDHIRSFNDKGIICPITAVMLNKTGQFYHLYSVNEAQAILGLSINSIKRLVREADTGDRTLFRRLTI